MVGELSTHHKNYQKMIFFFEIFINIYINNIWERNFKFYFSTNIYNNNKKKASYYYARTMERY